MSARKLKVRKLRASEVTFTVIVEQDACDFRGAFASGDAEQDAADERAIAEALDRGNVEAWCTIEVKAEWQGIEGIDTLGGCSFLGGIHRPVQAQIDECIEDHGMRTEALAALNAEVQRQAEKSLAIIERLTVKPRAKRASKRGGK